MTATSVHPDCQIPDLTGYHLVHRGLRWGAAQLAQRATRLDPSDRDVAQTFGRWTRGYLGELHAHHTVEDTAMFPALVERVPVAASLIERTDADHAEMDHLMARIERCTAELLAGGAPERLAPALADLSELMESHLDFEDAEVLPLFERHFTASEYQRLDDEAVKQLSIGKQALFTVPFLVTLANDDEFSTMWATAPLPLKAIYRLTRRGHVRRTEALFGPDAFALATF